jgi:hypothetical protein
VRLRGLMRQAVDPAGEKIVLYEVATVLEEGGET